MACPHSRLETKCRNDLPTPAVYPTVHFLYHLSFSVSLEPDHEGAETGHCCCVKKNFSDHWHKSEHKDVTKNPQSKAEKALLSEAAVNFSLLNLHKPSDTDRVLPTLHTRAMFASIIMNHDAFLPLPSWRRL